MTEPGFYALLALVIVNALLVLWLLFRQPPDNGKTELLVLISAGNDKTEREVRREIVDNGRANRQELSTTFATFQQTLTQQSAEAIRTQNTQIDAFGQQLMNNHTYSTPCQNLKLELLLDHD